jgi:ABC-type transport system involved in multi-copper enzyme maturation permease subunit
VGQVRRFPITTERIRAIARNTFKEAVRNRAFLGLMVLALLFLGSSLVLSALAVSDQAPRVVVSFGFFGISLFGVLIAVVMGVILVYKEIERKTIYTVIPKPVHRFEIILGKYLGLLAILVIEIGVLSTVWLLILWGKDVVVTAEYAKALLLVFCELMLVTAVALLFSSFSSPILSGIFATLIFVVGRLVYIVDEMLRARAGLFTSSPELRPFGRAIVAVFPDLNVFNVSHEVLLGVSVEWSYVASAIGYALSYVVVLLAAATLLFQRRDFV